MRLMPRVYSDKARNYSKLIAFFISLSNNQFAKNSMGFGYSNFFRAFAIFHDKINIFWIQFT